MKLFVNCKEANHVCDKNQYRDAGFIEKLKLNFHLIYCGACRKYSAKNTKLTKTIHRAGLKSLSASDKDRMREKLEKNLID